MKRCKTCQKLKVFSAFSDAGCGRPRNECKQCRCKYAKAYKAAVKSGQYKRPGRPPAPLTPEEMAVYSRCRESREMIYKPLAAYLSA